VIDGTGVPVVPRETAGRRGKDATGKAKTREAKIGCVFTQTKQDEEGYPVRDEDSTSYVGAIESAEIFASRIYAEAVRRGLRQAQKIVVLEDGGQPGSSNNHSLLGSRSQHCYEITWLGVRGDDVGS
jgi:hypothetical protein